jgi:hypothetical protein
MNFEEDEQRISILFRNAENVKCKDDNKRSGNPG